MLNGLPSKRIVHALVPILGLLSTLSITPTANGAVANSSPRDGGATALKGTWCRQDSSDGETIIQYSAAGWEVMAFTVLSEADPRQIGRQATMHLTLEAPNVFSHRDFAGGDEVFSVHQDGLTVDSFRVQNRGTREEARQAITTQTYHRCDVRQALHRAQAFLSSPKAEAATRKAMQREADRKAEKEQWEREDATIEERRNSSQEAYYTDLIQQLVGASGGE